MREYIGYFHSATVCADFTDVVCFFLSFAVAIVVVIIIIHIPTHNVLPLIQMELLFIECVKHKPIHTTHVAPVFNTWPHNLCVEREAKMRERMNQRAPERASEQQEQEKQRQKVKDRKMRPSHQRALSMFSLNRKYIYLKNKQNVAFYLLVSVCFFVTLAADWIYFVVERISIRIRFAIRLCDVFMKSCKALMSYSENWMQ